MSRNFNPKDLLGPKCDPCEYCGGHMSVDRYSHPMIFYCNICGKFRYEQFLKKRESRL